MSQVALCDVKRTPPWGQEQQEPSDHQKQKLPSTNISPGSPLGALLRTDRPSHGSEWFFPVVQPFRSIAKSCQIFRLVLLQPVLQLNSAVTFVLEILQELRKPYG